MTVKLRAKGIVLVMFVALAACATPRQAGGPSPHYKIGEPYKVNGRWYYPAADPNYDKVGVASWYGDEFHGRRTANGEIFDKNRLTAAHTTLPMPSLVEVQNLENGRKVVVRVNDRGPFAGDRIIDLSREAARRLGFERQGLARVRVRYAGPADLSQPRAEPRLAAPAARMNAPAAPAAADKPPGDDIADILKAMDEAPALTPGAEEMALAETADTPPVAASASASPEAPPAPQTLYAVRVAALWSLDYLDTLRARLGAIGPLRLARVETESGKVFYRVSMGPYADRAEAARRLEAVREAGYADAALVTITP